MVIFEILCCAWCAVTIVSYSFNLLLIMAKKSIKFIHDWRSGKFYE